MNVGVVGVEAANEQHEERARPHQAQGGPDVLQERILEPLDDGVKARVGDELSELRKTIQVRAVDCVDFGLCLLD
jgi:hypothetical protein